MSAENNETLRTKKPGGSSRMPSNSRFFEKAIPILLVSMAVLMGALILFAAGILLGFISF
ncbi:MAG TPA: hypothetical protein VLA49_06150 [Anaerolineales bacterium]|nr:hypothetical protein [Anaerolineales bacterium]